MPDASRTAPSAPAEAVRLPSLAMLGTGSMNGAILGGLLQPGVEVDGDVRVTTLSAASAEALGERDGVAASSVEEDADANRRAVRGARVVVVGVKPHMVPDLLREIADDLDPGALVISVAAGVTIATFESLLPAHVAVLRSMPNTPSLVGRGVTGLAAGTRSGPEHLALARAVFATVGDVVEVPEERIDALSTISGSGPAYVFLLIEELTRTAEAKGFSPDEARVLVQGTFRGAVELLAVSDDEPAELRRRVTSPNGTTERAVQVLQAADLSGLFDRATDAALARARELAAG
ncbi:pyrroline-5-carboxylate reductase [Clavibacter michiganensis]|uniref:pyrroline-5-carboxylate reductase n=2 Tax=Clavibacter michiganensis TaxID=28447 RepID=UPI000A3D42F6|nr:pyrroline-5-carboxylate reductase [Clavibacter michiganensis]MDO4100966.1 pyrroline-5-carboxylate reductase [Clavibacter michiganensis]MDO4127805.1 pyrroline-5-carboxylate reductase [Clavibacter michiganensis]NIY59428.1 pyrroline-5-carboxylate reductase [Clavibacter michiganensis subsp. michiganensis]OUE22141.1 Pyrroline-5-carboxylate reductase [Clavibacter michiganensis subsp. michiganensis]QXP03313.1 pyrroline-5-carboxylate reductase [Clavibacter michiganensis subsp. michiganensis]